MAEKYNLKNPAVKRILQEDNIFEWQFAIRGPCDTEFEGGIYHGRIQLPAEYPFKPPSFMLLTPNGRFETQTKICLSISNHHPEHWQPSWSVRTALVALIAFMPTNPNGALGSLDYEKEERHSLAIKSRGTSPKFGTPERQKLIDEIHEYMLSKAPPVPELSPELASEKQTNNDQANIEVIEAQGDIAKSGALTTGDEVPEPVLADSDTIMEEQQVPANGNLNNAAVRTSQIASSRNSSVQPLVKPQVMVHKPDDDRLFTWAAIGLTVAILVLLLKKFMKSSGHSALFMDES